MRAFKKNPLLSLLTALTPLIFTGLVLLGLMLGMSNADDASRSEGVRLLQDALYRVSLHSYAVNGHFPPSLAYIEENYNIFIDRSRFVVWYDVFASNIVPDIRIFALDD